MPLRVDAARWTVAPLAMGCFVALFSAPAAGQAPSPEPSGTRAAPPAEGERLQSPEPHKLEKLVQALAKDESFKVRLQAAVLLGRSDDDRAVQPLIDALSSDPHYTVRAAAVTGIANLQRPRAIAHVVRRLAVDPEAFVREEARRGLAKFPRDVALPYVVAAYNSDDARVRRQVVDYIAESPVPLSEPVLARALGDVPDIAEVARKALRTMPADGLMRFLDGALEHREPAVRRGAIELLQDLGTADATKRVLKVYEKDIEEDEVKNAARNALRAMRQNLPIAEVVKDASHSPEKHTRARALRLLGVLGGPEAERVLLAALADDDIYVRGNAVMAIGELGEPNVLPSLEKLEDDPKNQRIVHLVRHALKQLRKKTP